MSKTTTLPEGLDEKSPEWHMEQISIFTGYKQQIGEPSPHLAMVGHMAKDSPVEDKVWLLGLYAASYSLPTAQVMWTEWPWEKASRDPEGLREWIYDYWDGIITRTERRCVRTPHKFSINVLEYIDWAETEYPKLLAMPGLSDEDYYNTVWDSVLSVKYFGRYIGIRVVEGLRRYCDVNAKLLDIRSLGGWSPKKALMFMFPQHANVLLTNDKKANDLTEKLAMEVMENIQVDVPTANHYVVAAMLCEYREAFERYHQYPGWTIDQEPALYAKAKIYWGDTLDDTVFWGTREALFPKEVLGEFGGWEGTRWPLTKTLRDHGYNWSDLLYDYKATEDLSMPVLRA